MEKEQTLKRFQFLKKDYSRGFIADCGFEAVKYEKGYLESRLKVLTRHRQQDNYIHAGVIATMADIGRMIKKNWGMSKSKNPLTFATDLEERKRAPFLKEPNLYR